MKLHNFKTVIVISIILLLCASFAQARLKAITEEDLDQVTAESGITVGLDLTVRVSSGLGDGSLYLYQDDTYNEGFRWSDFIIGGANINNPFPLSGNVTLDVGSSGTKTWLNISGLVMPGADNDLRVRFNNTYVRDGLYNNTTPGTGNVTYTLTDTIYLLGLNIGRDIDKLWDTEYLHLRPSAPPFIRISNSGNSGIEIMSEMAVFLDELRVRYSENVPDVPGNRFSLNAVFVYGHTNFDPAMQGEIIDDPSDAEYSGNPINWNDRPTGANPNGKLYGNAKIGGYIPTYTYDTTTDLLGNLTADATVNGYKYFPATIDVGSSGTTTLLRMNLPMAMSTRIGRMEMGGGGTNTDFVNPTGGGLGSHVIDNAALYKVQITLRNTY